ncbi:MAG: hypothetical protein JRF42_11765 [Deltaproteobacteria bacterium]|nr:hypothetical protein [Deltaproteobacteria bacterium]
MAVEVKVIKKPGRTLAEQAYVPEIAKGLGFAMGRFFKNTFGPPSAHRPRRRSTR